MGDKMKIFLFILFGMIMSYGLMWLPATLGDVFLSGGVFGLLLYIAIQLTKNQSN